MGNRKPHLIGITGYAGHGKDSVANTLREHGYVIVRFGYRIYQTLEAINPMIQTDNHGNDLWTGNTPHHYGVRLSVLLAQYGWEQCKRQFPDVRELLQRTGENLKPIHGDDVWARPTMKHVDKLLAGGTRVAIADLRRPIIEGEPIYERGGVVWRVHRPNFENGVGVSHISERDIVNFIPEEHIDNDGTLEKLKIKVEILLGVRNDSM